MSISLSDGPPHALDGTLIVELDSLLTVEDVDRLVMAIGLLNGVARVRRSAAAAAERERWQAEYRAELLQKLSELLK